MAGLPGYGGAVYLAAQTSTSLTNEACTNSGDDTTYQVTNGAKRLLDDSATTTVQLNPLGVGAWGVVTNYTIDYATGRVTFDAANNPADTIRFSTAKYFTATEAARAKEWTLDIERAVEDDTEFGSSWETSLATLGKASGSVKLNWSAGNLAQIASTTPRFVIQLFVDEANTKRYQFYALLSKDGVSANVKSLVEEELAFQSAGKVSYETT